MLKKLQAEPIIDKLGDFQDEYKKTIVQNILSIKSSVFKHLPEQNKFVNCLLLLGPWLSCNSLNHRQITRIHRLYLQAYIILRYFAENFILDE